MRPACDFPQVALDPDDDEQKQDQQKKTEEAGKEIEPLVAWFRIETDPVPAFYTMTKIGHNNRKGWTGGLRVKLVEEQVSLNASYSKAKVVEQTPLQADRSVIELSIGTDYASF